MQRARLHVAVCDLVFAAQVGGQRCNSPRKICSGNAHLPFNAISDARSKNEGCAYAFQTAGACCASTTP